MELEAFLIAGALTCAIWVCLPDVLLLLGVTRIRCGVLGGPEDVRSGPGEVLTEEIAEQLDALGFVAAGLYWERLPAHKTFHEVVFVSGTGDCFAAVYRLFNNDPSRVALKTAFGDGAYVLTQNYDGGMEANEGTLRAGGLLPHCTTTLVQRAPLAEVLEEHRQRVRCFVMAGHEPLPAVAIDDHVEAERKYTDHPAVQRVFRGSLAVLLPLKLAFLVAGPGLVVATWGVDHAGIWATLLAASLGVLLFRYYGFPLLEALDKVRPSAEESH
jgi:hypothetical protein